MIVYRYIENNPIDDADFDHVIIKDSNVLNLINSIKNRINNTGTQDFSTTNIPQ